MQHSVFIEAWLFWLRPLTPPMDVGGLNAYRCLATPFSILLNRWMECLLPRAEIQRPDAVPGWIEGWSNLTGVVPRSLYLEVLERTEVLRTRLEEAEATIQQLREVNRQDVEKQQLVTTWETAINLWQIAMQTTVKTQNEWMRTWSDFAFNNHQRG